MSAIELFGNEAARQLFHSGVSVKTIAHRLIVDDLTVHEWCMGRIVPGPEDQETLRAWLGIALDDWHRPARKVFGVLAARIWSARARSSPHS